ncbi:uncharacterized protein LOC113973430 [Neopelma chrysocephalum]|uniref:uncharacterized protein LOC113973430 n=1 Tax=Neopelma chrysocephalum TaxID=114329 RepID=UPI000FCD4D45|nr:uncharacterized protein LOC113973430 [Neopelma chrysocephalum]
MSKPSGAAPHQFSLRERWHRARPPFTAAFSFALIHCVSFLAACEEQRESLFQQTGPIRSTRLSLERGLEKRDGGEGVSPTPPGPRVPPARRFPANTGAKTLPQPLEDQGFGTWRRKPGASNTEIISWIVPDVREEAGKPQGSVVSDTESLSGVCSQVSRPVTACSPSGRGCGEPRLRGLCDIWSDREVTRTEENKSSGGHGAAPQRGKHDQGRRTHSNPEDKEPHADLLLSSEARYCFSTCSALDSSADSTCSFAESKEEDSLPGREQTLNSGERK